MQKTQKTDKEENLYYNECPTFGIYQFQADLQCCGCKGSWRPTEKKALGTDTEHYTPCQKPHLQNIYEAADKEFKTLFCLLADGDWNDTSFQQFHHQVSQKDSKMKIPLMIFNYLMDNYHHSSASNSSAFGIYIKSAAKAKVSMIIYNNI